MFAKEYRNVIVFKIDRFNVFSFLFFSSSIEVRIDSLNSVVLQLLTVGIFAMVCYDCFIRHTATQIGRPFNRS